MIDPVKTDMLREKLNQIRGDETPQKESSHKSSSWFFFIVLFCKIASLHFTQVFIFEKIGIIPFLWWQTPVMYFGLIVFTSFFKKSE